MHLPLASLFVVGLVSLSVRTVTGDNSTTVPHPDCTVGTTGRSLSCNAGNYSIPGNFDLSLVPQNTSSMRLGSLGNTIAVTFRPDRLSTIHHNAPPLNVATLRMLSLYSFQGTNGTRLPIEAFLINVKGVLTSIILRGCRIGSLGATFLQGFSKLAYLGLGTNDISAIDINAFETRVSIADAALPVVATITLDNNEISTLDWAVFAPVAHSLTDLSLNEQEVTTGLSTLTLSKPFKFAVLEELELQDNEMNFPSRAILDTLNITSQSSIRFERNAFCPDEETNTCSCCEAKDFITWTHEIKDGLAQHKPWHLSFSCGENILSSNWEIVEDDATLPPKDQYQGCVAGGTSTTKRTAGTTTAKPTIGTTTTKPTTRTTKVIDVRSSTSSSVTPTTRPNELVGSSPVPGGSGWINRSATGLYGIGLVVSLFLGYSL